ncbi:MAG: ankyrin repeat domain-containing protein [Rickettsiaceae bacterium]|nr:ankyrin repeat domain-containing protein [Rickettsiaceae bacterium]
MFLIYIKATGESMKLQNFLIALLLPIIDNFRVNNIPSKKLKTHAVLGDFGEFNASSPIDSIVGDVDEIVRLLIKYKSTVIKKDEIIRSILKKNDKDYSEKFYSLSGQSTEFFSCENHEILANDFARDTLPRSNKFNLAQFFVKYFKFGSGSIKTISSEEDTAPYHANRKYTLFSWRVNHKISSENEVNTYSNHQTSNIINKQEEQELDIYNDESIYDPYGQYIQLSTKKTIIPEADYERTIEIFKEANKTINTILWQVSHGFEASATDPEGNNAGHIAASFNEHEIISTLARNGIDLNKPNYSNITALIISAQKGFANVAKSLIQNGADANLQGRDGITPLLVSVLTNNILVMDLLLKSGADPNLSNNLRISPLHLAFFSLEQNGMTAAIKLLESGADPNATDIFGRAPIVYLLKHHPDEAFDEIIPDEAFSDVNTNSLLGNQNEI